MILSIFFKKANIIIDKLSKYDYNKERSDVMVLFTYTDYLRCTKLLQTTTLTVQEDSTPYVPLEQKQEIYHKHDKLYRDLLNNKKEFSLFLQDFFCYWLQSDFVKYNRSFITKDYSSKYSDVIFKLKNKPVYLLIEHQSYIDYAIPYRIYKYYSCILDDTVDSTKAKTKSYNIPLITPIILYTGNQSWNFTPNFQEHQFDYTYNNKLNNGKLSLAYNFINIHDFSKEELLQKHSMIAYAMALDKCNNVTELIDTINSVYDLTSNEQKVYLCRMIKYVLKPLIPKEIYEALLRKFNNEEETYMEELVERMKKDLEYRRKKAESEGMAKGIAKGKLETNIRTAKKMLEHSIPVEDISDITGLSIKEINKLKIA